MSFIEDDNTTTWSWRHKISKAELEPYEKLILYTLSLYVTEMGQAAFPSIERLEQQTGLSRKTVLKYLGSCAEKNWLFIVKTKGANGRQQVNKYYPAFPSVNGTLDGKAECISGQLPSGNGEDTECNSSTVYINRNIKDKYKENNKSVLTHQDLTPRKSDTVPVRHFGKNFVEFRNNLPEEFKKVMRTVWGADQIGGMTALENFYNYNAMKGGRFTPAYWCKLFKTYMHNEK